MGFLKRQEFRLIITFMNNKACKYLNSQSENEHNTEGRIPAQQTGSTLMICNITFNSLSICLPLSLSGSHLESVSVICEPVSMTWKLQEYYFCCSTEMFSFFLSFFFCKLTCIPYVPSGSQQPFNDIIKYITDRTNHRDVVWRWRRPCGSAPRCLKTKECVWECAVA